MKIITLLFFIIWVVITGCANREIKDESTMHNQPHQDSIRQFIHQYIEEIWNTADFSHADKYWGPDFKNAFAPDFPHGPDGMKTQVAYFLRAFKPFHLEIKDIMIEGDKVAAWAEITGTHVGELFGIPATNKEVKFREAVWWKIKDGKLDEVYPFVDWNTLFEQLGQYPGTKNE